MRYMEKIKDKGVAIGERNIIEKMFENGFSISEITKITGKSADDIESLMNMNTEIDFDYEWAAWQNEVRLRMRDEEKIREIIWPKIKEINNKGVKHGTRNIYYR